jgi:uncharacterized membrane protein
MILTELMKEGAFKARSLVLSSVLISIGVVMLIDQRGMTLKDIQLFNLLGLIFLIGGIICLSLNLYVLRQSTRSKMT